MPFLTTHETAESLPELEGGYGGPVLLRRQLCGTESCRESLKHESNNPLGIQIPCAALHAADPPVGETFESALNFLVFLPVMIIPLVDRTGIATLPEPA